MINRLLVNVGSTFYHTELSAGNGFSPIYEGDTDGTNAFLLRKLFYSLDFLESEP